MYAQLDNLCHYTMRRPTTIISNRHFLKPSNPIYGDTQMATPDRVNFNPGYWGADAWKFLFSVARGYSAHPTYSERTQMRRFLSSLTHCLPCEKCRDNFCSEVLLLENKDLVSPASVEKWLESLRKKISDRNPKKPQHSEKQNEKKEAEVPMCCGNK
jgi:hypothetical protein